MTNLINCGTCGYPLTPEERTSLIERDGVMVKPESMTKDEAISTERALDLALEALENNRRTHYYCEDTWYSCPKHEDGCANEAEGDECNCGADKANQEIDKAITAIKQARSATVQEPVAKHYMDGGHLVYPTVHRQSARSAWVHATEWRGLTDEEIEQEFGFIDELLRDCVHRTEAKVREKNSD
jgi:hypothetical protein